MNIVYENVGYQILSAVAAERNVVGNAIDWLLENCGDARWDAMYRANKILLEGIEANKSYLETNPLWEWLRLEMDKHFRQDCIYYTINHDGFRL